MKRKARAPRIGATHGRTPLGRAMAMVLCALCVLLAAAATASATAPTLRGTFDCSGTPDGSCTNDKLAVDEATGDVYMVDNAHDAIDKFDSSGNYVSRIRGSNTTSGTFGFSDGSENPIAVDNSGGATQGNVYVVSEARSFSGDNAVFAFNSSGTELWERPGIGAGPGQTDECGIAVDPSGNPWIADYYIEGATQLRASDGGTTGRVFSTVAQSTNPCEIAFDATGVLYADSWHSRLDKYDATGAFATTLDAGPVLDVATDHATGDVYAVTNGGSQISEWDSSGTAVSGTPFDTGSTILTGVAVNGPARLAYVSDVGNNDVQIFDLPALPRFRLTATVVGSGRVDADTGAIAGCTSSGGTCSDLYTQGTRVTLRATPDPHWTFTGWSSGGCSGTGDCVVNVTANTNVTATFARIQHRVTVSKNGTGSGRVISSPAGIDCGSTCNALFDEASTVRLTATADPHSAFTGWSGGGCSGTGDCVVTVNADTNVTATFARIQHRVTVSTGGTGSGSVTSSPAGINCGSTCSALFDEGASVTLTATPAANSTFAGWSGGDCSGTGTCTVAVNADTAVTATFTAVPHGCPQVVALCNARLVLASHTATIKGSTASVKVSCTGDAGGTCRGSVTFKATVKVKVRKGHKTVVKKKTITVGSASYDLAVGSGGNLSFKLSSAARSALKRGNLIGKAAGLDGSVKFPRTPAKHKKKHK